MFQSHQAERAVRICAALIERVRYAQRIAHPIHIAFDEWNVWYRTRSHEDRVGGVEERYNLSDALAIATYLNGFIRQCRVVRIANFAQLVNAIAPIFTSPDGLFLQTIYHPLRLYAEHTQRDRASTSTSTAIRTISRPRARRDGRVHHVSDLGPFTLLDAAATCDEAGRTRLGDGRQPRRATATSPPPLDLGGRDAGSHGQGLGGQRARRHATNSFEAPRNVDVQERQLTVPASSTFTHAFPAHSITILRLDLR